MNILSDNKIKINIYTKTLIIDVLKYNKCCIIDYINTFKNNREFFS